MSPLETVTLTKSKEVQVSEQCAAFVQSEQQQQRGRFFAD
jgi:hypothetical protein